MTVRVGNTLQAPGGFATRTEQERYGEALDHLRGIASGEVEHDFQAVEQALAERDLPSGR